MKEIARVNGDAYPPEEPSEPAGFAVRLPKNFRVGYREGMVLLVLDPGEPDSVIFPLDQASARQIGQDLVNAASGAPVKPHG